MTKRAVLVLGAEGTGTRVVTRLLIAAGYAGDDGHTQRWDAELPTDEPLVVWRRSLPHGGQWPDVDRLVRQLVERGYDVTACVTSRDWAATVRSQIAAGHSATPAGALWQLRRAYITVASALHAADVPFVVASYESLSQHPEAAAELLLQLGVTPPATLPTFFDGNAKHFTGFRQRLTPAQRQRLVSVNEDHHLRMGALHQQFVRTNALPEIQRLDAESMDGILNAMRGCAERYAMRGPTSSILELGASTGHKSAFLLRELAATEYTGVEVVGATAKVSPFVYHMPLEEMPPEWGKRFSFVFSRHVMEHVVDVDTALRTIKMVLAPNGVVGAITPHLFPDPEPAHLSQLTQAQWIAAYARNGFKVVYSVLHQSHCPECHIVAVHEEWPT